MSAVQTEQDRLLDHVQQIADNITNGIEVTKDTIEDFEVYEYGYELGDIVSGWHYIQDAYDFRYLVDSENELLKLEMLVAYGGPNIWVDIWADGTGEVRGYWWGSNARATIHNDAMGIFETCQELRECR